MKSTFKIAALALICLTMAGTAAEAKPTYNQQNCHMRVDVLKHQNPLSFTVTASWRTPNSTMRTGASYPNLPENAVNDWAINAAMRLCYIANDFARIGDPCPEVDLIIDGDLTGYGNYECPTPFNEIP